MDGVKGRLGPYVSEMRELFSLSLEQIDEMILSFHQEMELGLKGCGSSLSMLPTYARRPTGSEVGDYLVLDIGGTLIKVLKVSLQGGRHSRVTGMKSYAVPSHVMNGDCEEFFNYLAVCVESFLRGVSCQGGFYPMAFTFSFPLEHTSLSSGRLIRWTKGFNVRNVLGKDVSVLLNEALQRRGMGFIRVASLMNDTVATLVAGAYRDPYCDMGVILGTGTNASYFENWSRIYSSTGGRSEVVINMEWGSFNRLYRNMFDEVLDKMSPNSGEQQFEKMTSGKYLGEVMRLVLKYLKENGVLSVRKESLELSHLIRSEFLHLLLREDRDILVLLGWEDLKKEELNLVRRIARFLLERSARLISAAIVAVVKWMDPCFKCSHKVAVDGALFTQNQLYRRMVKRALREILGEYASNVSFFVVKNGSAIGSAVSASYALANGARSM